MPQIFFWVFAVVAVGAGLLAITRKNALNCALSLVVSFVALAGLYFQLKAPFPGALQIILYAGAIMVLVIFVIMFLNVPEEQRTTDQLSIPGILASLFLLVPLAAVLIGVVWSADLPKAPEVGASFGTVGGVGELLFQEWVFPFEVLSLLILVAMVGAVLLAKKRIE